MSALQISRDICSVDGGRVERISIGSRENWSLTYIRATRSRSIQTCIRR